MYDKYHASDNDIVNDNISPSSTNYVTHIDNQSIDTFTNILTPVMNDVMHDEYHSSDDVIPNNDLFSQSMSYVAHGDNHPIDTFTNILTPVMNYVMHDEYHSSDDVIPNNDLFSQSMNYVTHGACHSLHHVAQTMTLHQPQMTTLNNTVNNRTNNHENKLTKQSDSNLSIIVSDHISPTRHHNNPNLHLTSHMLTIRATWKVILQLIMK